MTYIDGAFTGFCVLERPVLTSKISVLGGELEYCHVRLRSTWVREIHMLSRTVSVPFGDLTILR